MATYSLNGAERWDLATGNVEPFGRTRALGAADIAIGNAGNPLAVAYANGRLVLHRWRQPDLFHETHSRSSGIGALSGMFLIGGARGMATVTYDGIIRQLEAVDSIVGMKVVDKPARAAALLSSNKAVHLWDVDGLLRNRDLPDENLAVLAKLRLLELN